MRHTQTASVRISRRGGKAERYLGWKAAYSFEEGIRDMLKA